MKNYAVMRKIGGYEATAVRFFDERSDADLFRSLLEKSEDKDYTSYSVYELMKEEEK